MKSYDLSHLSVLAVDDHKFALSFLREILRALGIRDVHIAGDADTAIQMSAEFQPDIIFCDFVMPKTNGLEFIHRIRSGGSKWDVQTPIIMFSSFSEQFRVYEARDAGSSHYLTKPASPASVYDRIVRIINEQRPFIKTDSYKGPDRRRKKISSVYTGEDRRKSRNDIIANPEVSLSKEELDVLLEKTG